MMTSLEECLLGYGAANERDSVSSTANSLPLVAQGKEVHSGRPGRGHSNVSRSTYAKSKSTSAAGEETSCSRIERTFPLS